MSLLQDLIVQLTTFERRRAAQWLDCPLHNHREDVRLLFQRRLTGAPDTEAENQAEYTALYGEEEAYHPSRHRQVEHQLLKRLEAFLAWEHYQRDAFAAGRHLLHSYRERGLDEHHRTRLRRYRPGDRSDPERLHFDYLVATEKYDLALAANRGGSVDYQTAGRTLEHYQLALRLRQLCTTLAHQRLHRAAGDNPISQLEATLRAADTEEARAEPFIHLYYLVARLQQAVPGRAETTFRALIEGLTTNGHRLPATDQRNLLLLALNYGLRSLNAGWEPAIASTLALYRVGLDRDILHDRGVMSIFTFNNILALALRLQEVNWATEFLETYREDLPAPGGAEVVALGRARLAVANGEDGEALFHLQQADFRDFIHHLTARTLQLKIYFRQDSYTLLQSHLSSTRKLLTRRKGVGYHLQNYRNIFALANAVSRLAPGDTTARQQLRKKIDQTDPCTEKPWLLSLLA
ncbi:MAG: hypothetical protein AAFZ52_04685 [Bacteroidota bacterium]